MAADDFFARWASKKNPETAVAAHAPAVAVDAAPAPVTPEQPPVPPTLEQAEALTASSDFAPFMARGVDDGVKRLALKKLFADPHFNIMDGLDIYIEDYNTFVPMTADMVAALNHGKMLLDPLAHLEKPLMQLLQTPPAPVEVVMEEADAALENGVQPDDAAAAVEGGADVVPVIDVAPTLTAGATGAETDAAADASPATAVVRSGIAESSPAATGH